MNIEELKEEIKNIQEPRRTRYGNIRHKLEDIIILIILVMTSDGIHDYVDIDYMEEIICSEKSPQEKCNALMQAASHNGSVDDSSIVLIY